MTRITFILGLPGSGKTHLAKSLMTSESTLIDDLNQNIVDVDKFIKNPTPHLIITDPLAVRYTPEWITIKLKELFGECEVEFIPFENDPLTAYYNTKRRNDGRKISRASINTDSARYKPELWGTPVPVYDAFAVDD